MKKLNRTILLLTMSLFVWKSISAEDNPNGYGKRGGVEASLGISSLNFTNLDSVSIDLAPAVNHFLLDKIYLRYGLGMGALLQGSQNFNSYRLAPSLGAGYTFSISNNWYLNVGIYYSYGYAWYTSPFSNTSGSYQGLHLAPELKYVITQNWLFSVMADMTTNVPYLLNGRDKGFVAYTTIYLSASYYFP